MSAHAPSELVLEGIAAARLAIEQSRARHYVNGHSATAACLSEAILRLEQLKAGLRAVVTLPDASRQDIHKAIKGLQLELRNAELLHTRAAALRAGWAHALASSFSIETGAGYGPDALHGIAASARRIRLDG